MSDCVLVVPPLADVQWPALGVHLLAAAAREAGFDVRIRYANVDYAARVGLDTYRRLVESPGEWLLGERLFCRAAFDAPPLGFGRRHLGPTDVDLVRCEAEAVALVDDLAEALAGAPIVGVTSSFDTTAAAVALLRRVAARSPSTVTLLGGPNCDGEMAKAVATLGPVPHHVFSGESEAAFVAFLRDRRGPRVIDGAPVRDLDALPVPEFSAFFDAITRLGLDPADAWVQLESSRGCWWGEKHHCTFCGLNGLGMGFRAKSPDRFLAELRAVVEAGPTRKVSMTDNIMPHAYHHAVLPRLQAEVPGALVFYEQKANLDLRRCQGLRDAGCLSLQPGIEALDTDLLRRMDKGVTARQNVALLRYARILGLTLRYSLLWGFPGDDAAGYARTADLLPLLHHLQPPAGAARLVLDRFSPYFERPAEHGITDVAPWPSYFEVFPPHADVAGLATHHDGAFASGAREHPAVIARFTHEVARWQARWPAAVPTLDVRRLGPGRFWLVDTRGLGGPDTASLTLAQAHAALVGGPLGKVPAAEWAFRRKLAVPLDGWCVPLATCVEPLLEELEATPPDAVGPALLRFGAP